MSPAGDETKARSGAGTPACIRALRPLLLPLRPPFAPSLSCVRPHYRMIAGTRAKVRALGASCACLVAVPAQLVEEALLR
jgi:hypothetical protein